MIVAECVGVHAFAVDLLPYGVRHKIPPPKHLIHQHLEVVPLVVVDGHPDRAVFTQQIAQNLQTRQHHAQPLAVFQVVVVMLKRALGVVRRVNEYAFDLAGVEGKKRLQGQSSENEYYFYLLGVQVLKAGLYLQNR